MIVLLIVSSWLALLSFALVLVVRQLALLEARLSRSPRVIYEDDGLPAGTSVPDLAKQLVPALSTERVHLLLISATCSPCHDLARQMSEFGLDLRGSQAVALVPGREEAAQVILDMIPQSLTVLTDPGASEMAQHLQLTRVPSIVTCDEGVVLQTTDGLTTVSQVEEFIHRAA